MTVKDDVYRREKVVFDEITYVDEKIWRRVEESFKYKLTTLRRITSYATTTLLAMD